MNLHFPFVRRIIERITTDTNVKIERKTKWKRKSALEQNLNLSNPLHNRLDATQRSLLPPPLEWKSVLLDTPQNGCEGDNGFIGVKVINHNLPITSTKITKKS